MTNNQSPSRFVAGLDLSEQFFHQAVAPILAKSFPSLTMPSVSVERTSRLTSPSTILRIWFTASVYGMPALVAKVGFVVTPSKIPRPAISLTSLGLALSMKSFTFIYCTSCGNAWVKVWPLLRLPKLFWYNCGVVCQLVKE